VIKLLVKCIGKSCALKASDSFSLYLEGNSQLFIDHIHISLPFVLRNCLGGREKDNSFFGRGICIMFHFFIIENATVTVTFYS
jgi:hypothetical protein